MYEKVVFSSLKVTFRILKTIFSRLKVTFRNVKVTFSGNRETNTILLVFLGNEFS